MAPKKGARVTNKARLKRKEQTLRAKGYETWVPKRAKRKAK